MARILQSPSMAHYFAYDLDMDPKRVTARCPGARVARTAKLPFHRPEFVSYGGGEPILDAVPDEKKEIWGRLYFIPDTEVERLDRGAEPGKSKRLLPVWDPENRVVAAYVFANDAEGSFATPDKEYHSRILNSARLAEVPDKYYDLLAAVKPK